VKIYSEVGHGTTVRLYLPRSGEGVSAREPASAESSAPHREATILVVEDDADVRRVAAGQLEQMGHCVIEAENGAAALDVIKHNADIDLIFTDVVMAGGITGIELASEAAKIRPEVKVLLTSGFAETAMNSARLNATIPVLSKPYRKQDLARKVHDILHAAPASED
jgi:CheY-like chemotaxis protein